MTAIVLATPGYPNLPTLIFPVLGNKWTVGLFFMLHILFGSFTMGSLALGPTYELLGARRRDAYMLRYARGLAEINLKIFSVGATLAGFAVIFLTAFYGNFFIPLVERFWWPFLIAFLIWFPTVAALYVWAERWETGVGRPRHIALGYFAAFCDHLFLFMIVGVDSFLLTPAGGLGGFFNSTFWAELLHRFNGNISWASFLLAGLFAVRAALARVPGEREYRVWAAKVSLGVGLATLLIQVLLGAAYVEQLLRGSPGAFGHSFTGSISWMWELQVSLLAVLFVGAALYFATSRPAAVGWALVGLAAVCGVLSGLPAGVYGALFWVRYVFIGGQMALALAAFLHWRRRPGSVVELVPAARFTLAVTALAAVCLFLLMGVIRTSARDPYTVYGRVTQQQSMGIYSPPAGTYP